LPSFYSGPGSKMCFRIDPAKHVSGSHLAPPGHYSGEEWWTSKHLAVRDRYQAKPRQEKCHKVRRYYKTLTVPG